MNFFYLTADGTFRPSDMHFHLWIYCWVLKVMEGITGSFFSYSIDDVLWHGL